MGRRERTEEDGWDGRWVKGKRDGDGRGGSKKKKDNKTTKKTKEGGRNGYKKGYAYMHFTCKLHK